MIAALLLAVAILPVAAPRSHAAAPKKKDAAPRPVALGPSQAGDWRGAANGKALPGETGFVQEGAEPLVLTNGALPDKPYVVMGEATLGEANAAVEIHFSKDSLAGSLAKTKGSPGKARAKPAASAPAEGATAGQPAPAEAPAGQSAAPAKGKAGKIAGLGPEDADEPAAPLAPFSVKLTVGKDDSATLRFSNKKSSDLEKPAETRLPIRIVVGKESIEVLVENAVDRQRRSAGQPVELALVLSGGARIENLKVIELPNSEMVPLFETTRLANASLEPNSPIAVIDRTSLPKSMTTIDGVPFYFTPGERIALDVASSMSGAKEPFRNKSGYMDKASTRYMGRLVFSVPGDQYSALHVIAYSAGRPQHAPRMTVRIGYYGPSSAIMEDAVVAVPTVDAQIPGARSAEAPAAAAARTTPDAVAGRVPARLASGKPGAVYHLRIPLPQSGNVREFKNLDLEFTRDINTHIIPPDPNEFGTIPAGLPSDVVVLAATLERSPVTMTYTTGEPGNVFTQGQRAAFSLTLRNRADQPAKVRAFADAAGPGSGEELGIERRTWTVDQSLSLSPGEKRTITLDVTPPKRGWYSCAVGAEVDGRLVQRRDTTFAVLAPDTRQADEDSPFGVWEFWTAHSAARGPSQIGDLASLMHKGGWRWTYGGSPFGRYASEEEQLAAIRGFAEKYKIHRCLVNLPEAYQRRSGWFDEKEFNERIIPAMRAEMERYEPVFKVMHESRSSNNLLRRYSEFLGGAPYDMPPDEKKRLEEQFENVKKYCLAIKRADPRAKVALFNDYPAVVFQFLSRGFPADAFDVIGLEGAMFLRQPERQPDWLCLLGHMHEMKRAMAKYGYDKPIWTTEALYHPSEAGGLSLHEQAVISVREAMMALELGVKRMAAAGILKDPSDDYHWSNWGSAGFCYRDPEINPKPSYAMYAWLTQVLDRAQPAGKLPTPNNSLHVVDFKRPDGTHVYGVWTAKGAQRVTLEAAGSATVYDAYGNPLDVPPGALTLTASPTPHYVTGAVLTAVRDAAPIDTAWESGKPAIEFDDPKQFQPVAAGAPVLEGNWDTPRVKGDFDAEFVRQDGASAMRVSLRPDKDERKLLPRYVEYRLAEPITLAGRPHEFNVRVKGNSGWGQILFELIDAKGRVWTSCGTQYPGSSNSTDPLCRSFISFEGWQTLHIPIVGRYPGGDQSLDWPDDYNWWATNTPEDAAFDAKLDGLKAQAEEKYEEARKAYEEAMERYPDELKKWQQAHDAGAKTSKNPPQPPKPPKLVEPRKRVFPTVDYPLKLTKVIVTMRPHILYLDEEREVKDPVIYLDKLAYTQAPAGM